MGLFVKSQDGQTARASLLCWGGVSVLAPLPARSTGLPCRGSLCPRGAPTFHYGRILPRGPGCAGSRLLQELGSDPQPTGALGRGVGLGTRRAVGRAGSGGHSRDRAPWMGPHQPPQQNPVSASLPRVLPQPHGCSRGPPCPLVLTPQGSTPMLGGHRAEPHARAGGVRSPFNPLLGACLNQALLAPQAKPGFAQCPLLPGVSGGGQGAPLAPRSPGVHTSLSGSRLASC